MGQAPNFKNILFDLGGVILDINVQATLKQFYELGFPAELMQFPNSMTTDLYFRYETGKLDTEQFRNEIRKAAGVEMTDHAFDEAWNAMLVRFPEERIDLLKRLSKRYNLYMLSNTSSLHVKVFEKMYLEAAGEPMQKVFISTPQELMGDASKELNQRRAEVKDMITEGDSVNIESKAPVAEMFGFASAIRSATGGRVLWNTENIGFEQLPRQLQDDIVKQIRERKGLKPEPYPAQYYMD